jgi:hypothetical protein
MEINNSLNDYNHFYHRNYNPYEKAYSTNPDGYFYDAYHAGKEATKLSDEVFDEMKKDGFSIKAMDRAFDKESIFNANFEGSSFVSKNDEYIGDTDEYIEYMNSRKQLNPTIKNGQVIIEYDKPFISAGIENMPKKWKEIDAYENFEPLEEVYQSNRLVGANDKDTRFMQVMVYASKVNATEEEIGNKEFQIKAQKEWNNMMGLLEDILYINPRTHDDEYSKEYAEHYFNPTMEDVKDHTPESSIKFNFDSTEEILDFIEEKKEYYNTHQDQHSEIRLEYLNRMEDKLSKIDVFSMTQENKPSMKIFYDGKVENDRIVGTLYG